jgi:hypothetical protein
MRRGDEGKKREEEKGRERRSTAHTQRHTDAM